MPCRLPADDATIVFEEAQRCSAGPSPEDDDLLPTGVLTDAPDSR